MLAVMSVQSGRKRGRWGVGALWRLRAEMLASGPPRFRALASVLPGRAAPASVSTSVCIRFLVCGMGIATVPAS